MAKAKQLTTAFGIASYPWLTSPDTKFNKAGVYSVDLLLPADSAEATALTDMIDEKMEESYQAALEEAKTPAKKKKVAKANPPYEVVEDDEGEPTGDIKFHFKMNATGKGKDGTTYERKPKIYDAKGKNITESLNGFIGGGSELRVSYNFSSPWNMAQVGAGITLYLNGVQIKELVQSGASAESMGFGEVDGYEGDDAPAPAAATSDEDNDDDSEDGDF